MNTTRIKLPFLILWVTFSGLFLACSEDQPSSEGKNVVSEAFLPDSLQGDPETQLRALNAQISFSPDDYTLYKDRAVIYYELDSTDKAIVDIEKAIELFRNNPELHYWRGFFAFARNDTAKALEEFTASAGLGSKNPETFYQMGQIYFFQGNEERALQLYQRAAELDDSNPIYIFAQGYLEESRRRHSKAIEYYQQALSLDSAFDKALIRLHDVYFEHYQSEAEAMKYIETLLLYHPSHPLGRFYQGNYHMRRALNVYNANQMDAFQDRINQAVVDYTICINRDPDFAQALYNRGYCYFLADRHEEAMQDFSDCLEADPKHAMAAFMLGSIHEYFKDYQTALHYYQVSLKNNPGHKDTEDAIAAMKDQLK